MRQRQGEGDRGPLIRDARKPQGAPMRPGDAVHNGEPEACASCLTRAGLVDSVEAFTQVRQVLAGNADPSVLYLQERLRWQCRSQCPLPPGAPVHLSLLYAP